MDYLTALQKGNIRKAADLLQTEVLLYSNWETQVLEVFLQAYSQESGKRLKVHPSGFASLWMDLERLAGSGKPSMEIPLVVILDEESLIPGCSLRSDAVFTREQIERSLSEAGTAIQRLTSILSALAKMRTVFILPSLLPCFPLFPALPWMESAMARLRHPLRAALADLQSSHPDHIRVFDAERLWEDFPLQQLHDDRLLFTGGWPFNIPATDRMAGAIFNAVFVPRDSRKLLISDADQTLWKGIVGDDGVDHISWAQEAETYRFFIYQKTLNLLMSEGVLVALASKNSPESMRAALSRQDLILDKKGLVSCRNSWLHKSDMIEQILSETNLLPSSVVFVDDSKFELGEVKAAFPEVKCLQFPDNNLDLRPFLQNLRSSFDTRVITREDQNRAQTIKQTVQFNRERHAADSLEHYLRSLEMRAKIEKIDPDRSDRAFQLINKTNQFNLKGHRFDPAEWDFSLRAADHVAYQLEFQDKDSNYGIVSVLLADCHGHVADWVLSCRVFGRTIEHYMLNFLFKQLCGNGVHMLSLNYQDTGKNQVVRDFLNDHATPPSAGSNGAWVINGAKPLPTFIGPL